MIRLCPNSCGKKPCFNQTKKNFWNYISAISEQIKIQDDFSSTNLDSYMFFPKHQLFGGNSLRSQLTLFNDFINLKILHHLTLWNRHITLFPVNVNFSCFSNLTLLYLVFKLLHIASMDIKSFVAQNLAVNWTRSPCLNINSKLFGGAPLSLSP